MRRRCGVAGVLPPFWRHASAIRMSCSLDMESSCDPSFEQPFACNQPDKSSISSCPQLRAATRCSNESRAAAATAAQIASRPTRSGQVSPLSAHCRRSSARVRSRAPRSATPANSDKDCGGMPAAEAGGGALARGTLEAGPRQSSASCRRRLSGHERVSKASCAKRKHSAACGASHLSGCQRRASRWKARLMSASQASRSTPSTT
mmetsp:Transcript_99504/g.264461  ORF Transcript_99504/g.264461 Transcript_99504/m.264461 type:complete len:205 (+) Transcript_99504:1090-1704(+)